MRRTAGFLKFASTVVIIFEVLAALAFGGAGIALLFMGSFSNIANSTGISITISGTSMSLAEMDAKKTIILVAFGIAFLALVLTIIGTVKTRKAYSECKEERPFSDECVNSLLSAARLEIIGGLVGIIGSLIISFATGNLAVNGANIGSTISSLNLTFIFYAVQKYLFYHVANYGRKLENR